jgi:hypothetical protein
MLTPALIRTSFVITHFYDLLATGLRPSQELLLRLILIVVTLLSLILSFPSFDGDRLVVLTKMLVGNSESSPANFL